MGNGKDKDQGAKSNSNSPKSKKQKRDLNVQEDVADFVEELERCSTTSAMLEKARSLFRREVRDKYKYKDEAMEYKEDMAGKKKFEMILSMRSRIEFLETFLEVPVTDAHGKHLVRREDRWLCWFDVNKKSTFVMEFEAKIEAAKSSIEEFCESLHMLYGDFSDPAAHRIPLPKEITEADVDGLLQQIGVYKDRPVKVAVRILIMPLCGEVGNAEKEKEDKNISSSS